MTIQHLINGQSVSGPATFETINPATQEVLAEVATGGEGEVKAAVAAAKAAAEAAAAPPAVEPAAVTVAAVEPPLGAEVGAQGGALVQRYPFAQKGSAQDGDRLRILAPQQIAQRIGNCGGRQKAVSSKCAHGSLGGKSARTGALRLEIVSRPYA